MPSGPFASCDCTGCVSWSADRRSRYQIWCPIGIFADRLICHSLTSGAVCSRMVGRKTFLQALCRISRESSAGSILVLYRGNRILWDVAHFHIQP